MELGPSTIVALSLGLLGFLLYSIRTSKPTLSRDYDLFFSSVGFLCGGILLFQGWKLDPILLLCQILSTATAIFFIGESLWLRNLKNKEISLIPKKTFLETKPINVNKDKKKELFLFLKKKNFSSEIKLSVFFKKKFNFLKIDYTPPIDY
jgi:hypothetical protein